MDWWDRDFCLQLAQNGMFVVRYDNRDVGESTSYAPGTASYNVADLVEDIVRILDGHSIARAHLLGMSLGGMLAQICSVKHPDRVRSLILMSSSVWDDIPALPGIDPGVLDYLSTKAMPAWTNEQEVIQYIVGQARIMTGSACSFDSERATQRAREEFRRARSIASRFNHSRLTGCEDLYGISSKIQHATLVIHGDEDPVFPWPHAENLRSTIPLARLLRLSGIGHELPAAVWTEVIEAIIDFVNIAPQDRETWNESRPAL